MLARTTAPAAVLLVLAPLTSAAGLSRREMSISPDLRAGWDSEGCWTDSGARMLHGPSYTDRSGMTEGSCIDFCAANAYPFAGVEYAEECYCGRRIDARSEQVSDAECDMGCGGDAGQLCGGADRLNVFAGPITNPGPAGSAHVSCYTDSDDGGRALPIRKAVAAGDAKMTVVECTAACSMAGYSFAGVEYGSECYCGNSIRGGVRANATGCDMACSGNPLELCGGARRLDVYSVEPSSATTVAPAPGGWAYQGCYTDDVGARTLRFHMGIPGAGMTVGACVSQCLAAGYGLAGVENAQECFCDNWLMNNGQLTDSGCDMAKLIQSFVHIHHHHHLVHVYHINYISDINKYTNSDHYFLCSVDLHIDSDHALEGRNALSLTPTARGFDLIYLSSQISNLEISKSYNLTVAVGGLGSVVSLDTPGTFFVDIGSRVLTASPCGYASTRACSVPGNNGARYELLSATFQATSAVQKLQLGIQWIKPLSLHPPVFIDQITIQPLGM